MKTIEVKFPEVKGMKVNGATLDFKNGCSVVEYVEEIEFKRGDILFDKDPYSGGEWIFIFDRYGYSRHVVYYSVMINIYGNMNYADYVDSTDCRLATDSEKQLLFDALEKEGKYWDTEELDVKEFDKVPDYIGIYCCNRQTLYNKGDELYIGFNDDKQLLSTSDGIYTVVLNDSDMYSRVNCYLKPINHEDVKVGDTILCGDKEYLTNYFKVIENGCAYTSDENDMYTLGRFGSQDKLFKLIPIK